MVLYKTCAIGAHGKQRGGIGKVMQPGKIRREGIYPVRYLITLYGIGQIDVVGGILYRQGQIVLVLPVLLSKQQIIPISIVHVATLITDSQTMITILVMHFLDQQKTNGIGNDRWLGTALGQGLHERTEGELVGANSGQLRPTIRKDWQAWHPAMACGKNVLQIMVGITVDQVGQLEFLLLDCRVLFFASFRRHPGSNAVSNTIRRQGIFRKMIGIRRAHSQLKINPPLE